MFGKKGKKKEESQPKTDKSKKKEIRCPNCGSDDMLPAGFANLDQCQNCGATFNKNDL